VIVLAIREQHERFVADEQARRSLTASIEQVRSVLPEAASFGSANEQGGVIVHNSDGDPIGFVVQTRPAADDIIGYSGPNNVLLGFDPRARLTGLTLLSSGDTPSHVETVQNDSAFFERFVGKTWDELKAVERVDGVSGATLTSAAMAEGIVRRVGGARPSLRFPEPLTLADAESLFPEASAIEPDSRSAAWRVLNANGERLGLLLRTSPDSDNRIAYGGPTDALLALDAAGKHVVGIGIKQTYDTPRYVEDVTLDWTFIHRFDGMSLEEFSDLTVGVGADVEGVSGATMTSQVLVENLVEAAERFQEEVRRQESGGSGDAQGGKVWSDVRFAARDIGTAIVVLGSLVIAFTNLRGRIWLRRVWQVVLIVYLGLINVDLLSQALFVGWAQNDVAWEMAPGLVLLAVAALVVPLTTKTQLYCHHLCPHGAAQELLRNRLPWRLHLPKWFERLLSFLPAALLVLVVAVALGHWSVDLTGIEPFDAYALRAAGVATIVVAIVGLVASLFVPMAYCRYGCPTGALLGFLRRNRRSGQLGLQDALAAILAVAAAVVAWGH
jgi:Na+-translocating ferredoxin:NAD+ oxidoreductase RnfG subunit